jgi:hypothetical protein
LVGCGSGRLDRKQRGEALPLLQNRAIARCRGSRCADRKIIVPLKGPTEVGLRSADDKKVTLSQLIDKLNDRFCTDFKPADQLFFDQIAEAAVDNETLRTAAQANSMENFKPVF